MYGLTSTCPTRASASRVLSMVAYVLRQCRTMTTLDVCRPWISTPSRDCCSMEEHQGGGNIPVPLKRTALPRILTPRTARLRIRAWGAHCMDHNSNLRQGKV
ncbi:hypothetical protein EYF80_026462 [Liparis tanakae]|uniref:Uncharacterized protein n=1 Tax=Liparis tanakae TaxID=230148 RepID=A0A4Z2HCY2_9TELE|nr:hypothetical protein EYF80_026462 [Liparis tanakae]